MDPARYSATERLRDGRTILIRAQRPDDRDAMLAAFERASPTSVYRRFFGPRRSFTDKEADYFLNIDFVNHVAIVAEAENAGRRAIVGGARYVVVEPGRAEVAFVVIDEHQGKGIGGALLRHLAKIGRAAGLKEFAAEVLAENASMLKVFERSGLAVTSRPDGAEVHVTLRLV